MGMVIVVILRPLPYLFSHLVYIVEIVSIKYILSEKTVETFHISVLRRLSRLGIPDLYVVPLAPVYKNLRKKFRPVIASDIFRCTDLAL